MCHIKLNEILRVQMDMGFSHIAYNYMVCEDGNIYEGRGLKCGAHTAKGGNLSQSPNLLSVGVAFLGNFESKYKLDIICSRQYF